MTKRRFISREGGERVPRLEPREENHAHCLDCDAPLPIERRHAGFCKMCAAIRTDLARKRITSEPMQFNPLPRAEQLRRRHRKRKSIVIGDSNDG